MASARQDFESFVRWLYLPEQQSSIDARRLARLALDKFDALARTSRQRNQRSAFIVELMRQRLEHTADEAPVAGAAVQEGAWPWTRLRRLRLGPFRGFRTPEPFDLDKQITLFYGPNGSGKTSLCEALEYALLGDVEEAGLKRIAARTYLMNVHAQRFEEPALSAIDHEAREIEVIANPDTYRFCFIEKNRIDAFSRIAARPNAQRAELIATLFGMEQFSDFVSHFNESIDTQLILTAQKQVILTARRAALKIDHETVQGEAAALQKLDNEEAELARAYAPDISYGDLKHLIGSAETPSRLQELDTILETIPPAKIGVTRQTLQAAFEKAHAIQNELNEITENLRAQSDEVSFKGLYDAVVALQKTIGDRCPACDTPLNGPVHVTINPYDKAAAGLKQLEALGQLQEKQQSKQTDAARASRELRQIFGSLQTFLTTRQEKVTPIGTYLSGLPEEPEGAWWTNIRPAACGEQEETPSLEQVLEVADRIAAQDIASERTLQERQPHVAERQRLAEFQLKVQAQDLKRQQLRENIAAAYGRINDFDVANAELIAEVDHEKRNIERDSPLKVAYDQFLESLRSYRSQLPGQLMAGLNESAMKLYNSFNRNDLEADKIAALYLPLAGDDKIEIEFRGNPGQRVDALHVLSEGHIRCLGLAILLAKAKSIQCPVIVFDDAINAIDHDHRGGIRETIFESDHFPQTQFIVTCHSNEFIKDIQQHLPAPRRNNCQVYLLRHHDGNYQPRVTGNVPSANYITKARAARDVLNDRDALASSRQALEMLSEKVWRWLSSHDQGVLNLMLAGVNAEPALRNLCEALAKKLRDAQTFNHANKEPILAAYGRILGIPTTNLIWTYLNKGTHEEADRDDFDGDLVESVVATLEELDELDLRPGK